jgi:hypothetical protein
MALFIIRSLGYARYITFVSDVEKVIGGEEGGSWASRASPSISTNIAALETVAVLYEESVCWSIRKARHVHCDVLILMR